MQAATQQSTKKSSGYQYYQANVTLKLNSMANRGACERSMVESMITREDGQ
jgi:hypothetical protein